MRSPGCSPARRIPCPKASVKLRHSACVNTEYLGWPVVPPLLKVMPSVTGAVNTWLSCTVLAAQKRWLSSTG